MIDAPTEVTRGFNVRICSGKTNFLVCPCRSLASIRLPRRTLLRQTGASPLKGNAYMRAWLCAHCPQSATAMACLCHASSIPVCFFLSSDLRKPVRISLANSASSFWSLHFIFAERSISHEESCSLSCYHVIWIFLCLPQPGSAYARHLRHLPWNSECLN